MTLYELINLQRNIGDLEDFVKVQKTTPTKFTTLENWIISHLKIKKYIAEREQTELQEIELKKEVERIINDIIKETNN